MATGNKVVFLNSPANNSATSWQTPSDFVSIVSVEAIGAGGAGGGSGNTGGGGGGAYAKSTAVTGLVAGGTAWYAIGAGGTGPASGAGPGGGDTWFNVAGSSAPTLSSQGVLAKGGSGGTTTTAAGGASASCVGTTTYSGGSGAANTNGAAGGGGAAGPGGVGGDGSLAFGGSTGRGGGGGGASLTHAGYNAGSASGTQGATGGNGGDGTGGGTGGTSGSSNGVAGTAGTGGGGGGAFGSSVNNGGAGATGTTSFTQTSDGTTAGSGGGGGAGTGGTGGAGGLYGGGGGGAGTGGNGRSGLIVITYAYDTNINAGKKSGYSFPILNYDGSASDTKVDFEDMFVRKELFLDAGLWGWGAGTGGRLGDGTVVAKSSPIQIGNLTNWKQVSGGGTGDTTALAIKTDGTLWGWGNGGQGVLGNGLANNYSSPIQIGLLSNWKQVITASNAALAIKTDGTLWAWGNNGVNAVLGLGNTTASYSSPVQVGTLSNWKQVFTTGSSTLAVKTDGTLWSWGVNSGTPGIGYLGDGTTINKSSPIQIGTLTNWKYVGGSSSAGMAIKTDGTLWGWGYNNSGSVGNGSTVDVLSPVQIGTLINWKQVSGSFAIKTDGTLWSWGYNGQGALGLGDVLNRSSPVQVGSLTNWKYVNGELGSSGRAIKTDGTLWVWGQGSSGVLGDGTTVSKSSPIQLGNLTNWKYIQNTYGIQSPDLP